MHVCWKIQKNPTLKHLVIDYVLLTTLQQCGTVLIIALTNTNLS